MTQPAHGPTLAFSAVYQDERGNELRHPSPTPWPGVVWMWIPPTIGRFVEVPVAAEGGGVHLKRFKVVDVVPCAYGSEGMREYAGEMVLTFVGNR